MNRNKLYQIGFTMACLKKALQREISKLGYDCDNFQMDLLLNPIQVRNGIIREEYKKRCGHGECKDRIAFELMEKYKLSKEYLPEILKEKN